MTIKNIVAAQAHKILEESICHREFGFRSAGEFIENLDKFLNAKPPIMAGGILPIEQQIANRASPAFVQNAAQNMPSMEVREVVEAMDRTNAEVIKPKPRLLRKSSRRLTRAIMTPEGRFDSVADAAVHFEIGPTAIYKRLRNGHFDGWGWLPEKKKIEGYITIKGDIASVDIASDPTMIVRHYQK